MESARPARLVAVPSRTLSTLPSPPHPARPPRPRLQGGIREQARPERPCASMAAADTHLLSGTVTKWDARLAWQCLTPRWPALLGEQRAGQGRMAREGWRPGHRSRVPGMRRDPAKMGVDRAGRGGWASHTAAETWVHPGRWGRQSRLGRAPWEQAGQRRRRPERGALRRPPQGRGVRTRRSHRSAFPHPRPSRVCVRAKPGVALGVLGLREDWP